MSNLPRAHLDSIRDAAAAFQRRRSPADEENEDAGDYRRIVYLQDIGVYQIEFSNTIVEPSKDGDVVTTSRGTMYVAPEQMWRVQGLQ